MSDDSYVRKTLPQVGVDNLDKSLPGIDPLLLASSSSDPGTSVSAPSGPDDREPSLALSGSVRHGGPDLHPARQWLSM